jgi:Bacterial Ig-like domain
LTTAGQRSLYSIMRWLATFALAVALVPTSQAQSRYDIYGDPVDVTVQSLTDNPESYDGRAVRVKGRFDLGTNLGARTYFLQDSIVARVAIVPVRELAGSFESEALTYSGKTVEVTGVFKASQRSQPDSSMGGVLAGYVTFWNILGPPEEVKGEIKSETVSLESLVSRAGRFDGRTIRVYGRFRGKNLYGDLPSRSQRDSRDWVLKDDVYSVWVTGRKPKGSGFELDINMKRDTEKWIQVVGVPETIRGVTYLRAMQVVLGKPAGVDLAAAAPNAPLAPGDVAPLPAATPPPPPPPKPPVVVFALPLDGEADVPSNGRFQIQFSKDMEEETFKGRVLIRYAPPVRPGDRAFDGAKLSYDGGRRALTVDPGDVLRSGRVVEILLLPGIVDLDGQELVSRPGREGAPLGAVDMLRYQVLTASLLGAR